MEEIVAQTDSKQTVKGYSPSVSQTVFPTFDFDTAMKMVDSDPVTRAALNHYVSKCAEGDYSVVYLDRETLKFSYDKAFEILLDTKHNFRTGILRKLYICRRLFNNAFIEIVKNPSDNTTKTLNVLDPTIIKPITKPNGDPLYYEERPQGGSATGKRWDASEVVWVKFNDRSRGFAPVDLESIYTTILAKGFVTKFVAWLFQTGQHRLVFNFKNSSEADIESFLAYYEKAQQSFMQPLISKGEFTATLVRDMKEVDNIINLIKQYNTELLACLGVPGSEIGITDGSGRSNIDGATYSFSTDVLSDKKCIEDAVNFDLFPKMNKSQNQLRFGPVDRAAEEQVWSIAQIMQSMSIKPEVIQEHLFDKGIIFEEESIFLDPVEQAKAMAAVTPTESNNPRSKDTAPSRVNQKDTRGVGGVSKVSTRKEQL